jgi:flagellar motor switch protein FliN
VTAPFEFEGLPGFTRDQVELVNWAVRVLPGVTDWEGWCNSLFSTVMQRPSGFQLQLIQTHCLEADQPPKTHLVEKSTIMIGRNPDCDIVFPAPAVGKQHARLTFDGDSCRLEDLGSMLGTFVEQKKVSPKEPRAMQSGEAITIFPYRLEFRAERRWAPESDVRISVPEVKSTRWASFRNRTPEGLAECSLTVLPAGLGAAIQISDSLLDAMIERALTGVVPDPSAVPSDLGIAEFLFLCLMEDASRKLAFPLRIAPDFRRPDPGLKDDTPGLSVSSGLALTGISGNLRLFLPYALLERMKAEIQPSAQKLLPPKIPFRLPLSLGFVELTIEESARMEPGDILLFGAYGELLLPGDFSRGWRCGVMGDNPWKVRLDKYYERSAPVDSAAALGSLPLHLHIILGEKEYTLAELTSLAPGTIVELDRTKADPVQLAVNGKVVGTGELVQIEGKLGVKILQWSGA